MRLSELQTKKVINTKDGKELGTIIDAEVNESGQVIYFTIMNRHLLRGFFKSEMEVNITVKQIVKIGEDVILVDL